MLKYPVNHSSKMTSPALGHNMN